MVRLDHDKLTVVNMLILKIDMLTNSINEMKSFYSDSLGLSVMEETPTSFSVKAGESTLSFHECGKDVNPIYHFAFNIPENKMNEALKWITAKVPLIDYQGNQTVHFDDWNAHSVFFNDPAGNIVELIARHHLKNATDESFTVANLICVSEIGLPVTNVEEAMQKLIQAGISPWRDPSSSFASMGDENGLLITVVKGRVWFMSDQESYPYDLTVTTDHCTITLDGTQGLNVFHKQD